LILLFDVPSLNARQLPNGASVTCEIQNCDNPDFQGYSVIESHTQTGEDGAGAVGHSVQRELITRPERYLRIVATGTSSPMIGDCSGALASIEIALA
jgi:hypothetical protein